MLLVAGMAWAAVAADDRSTVAQRVIAITRDSKWTPVATIPIGFRTFHPQGMVKIGDTFFVSSVEVTTPTRRFAEPTGGYDRDPGKGVGHLFQIDSKGGLVSDLTLVARDAYHPGGIDYDGRHIWISLAEYRPNSHSVIYKVDPATMTATEVLQVGDHIGGIVRNTDDNTLHGLNWGSRRFYRWTLDKAGRATNANRPLEALSTLNTSHYVDYQDCKYLGGRAMLCSGLAAIGQAPSPGFRLGGLDLVSLADGRPLHQTPVPLWTPGGTVMTQNPFWIEPSAAGLRVYFMPEDDRSTIYVYDVNTK